MTFALSIELNYQEYALLWYHWQPTLLQHLFILIYSQSSTFMLSKSDEMRRRNTSDSVLPCDVPDVQFDLFAAVVVDLVRERAHNRRSVLAEHSVYVYTRLQLVSTTAAAVDRGDSFCRSRCRRLSRFWAFLLDWLQCVQCIISISNTMMRSSLDRI